MRWNADACGMRSFPAKCRVATAGLAALGPTPQSASANHAIGSGSQTHRCPRNVGDETERSGAVASRITDAMRRRTMRMRQRLNSVAEGQQLQGTSA